MNKIHLICGVPGSGKTYVCSQLESKYCYVAHDSYPVESYHKAIHQAAKYGNLPVLAECPFRASVLIEQLNEMGCEVVEYYLVEPLDITIKRYEYRDKKPYPKMHITNYNKYSQRSPRYNQVELLKVLSE